MAGCETPGIPTPPGVFAGAASYGGGESGSVGHWGK